MKFLKDRLPDRETLLAQRWVRPFAGRLGHRGLWCFNRRSVARGVAIGVFFGLLLPVAQIILAAIAAIGLRANVAVAAGATLITNPLTFPPIYYGAMRTGHWILGDAGLSSGAGLAAPEGWLARLAEWFASVGPALGVGLALFAVVGAIVGYVAVHLVWRIAVVRRRSRRA